MSLSSFIFFGSPFFFSVYFGESEIRSSKIFHLSGLAFAFIIQVLGWYCPLTYLEVWLRSRHDSSLTYTGSFIIHYVERIVYIELSRYLIFVLTLVLCGLNLWLYLKKTKSLLK